MTGKQSEPADYIYRWNAAPNPQEIVMDDIREQVTGLIYEAFPDRPLCERVADRTLALPEIAEALLLMRTARIRFGDALRQADPTTLYCQGLMNAHPWANLLKPEDMPRD